MKESSVQWRLFKDKIFLFFVFLMSFIVTIPLFVILFYIVKMGFSSINWEFLTRLPKPMGETGGGIINGIIGSIIIILSSSVISIPFGVSVGIYLSEFKHKKLAKYV
jgi:phosphate transport system permease protein